MNFTSTDTTESSELCLSQRMKSIVNDQQNEKNSINITSVEYAVTKIQEFSESFNSLYRLPLLNCEKHHNRSLFYLLDSLKKSINLALWDMGKTLTRRVYSFKCSACNEELVVQPGENIWTSLQSHEHFEELYYKFLNNQLEIENTESESSITSSQAGSGNNITIGNISFNVDSNTCSSMEQLELDPPIKTIHSVRPYPEKSSMESEEDNTFRFNFSPTYHETVEAKIYPSTFMQGIRKYDKVRDFTIQRTGNCKAFCLICQCEMSGMRINKNMLVNHTMGQRHLKAAVMPEILNLLKYYHDFWLKQEPSVQAHQVYFRPYIISTFKCSLCSIPVQEDEVFVHILKKKHKQKVLEMYERRSNIYFLINLQIQLYGITQEEYEAKEEEFKKQEEAHIKSRQKKGSDLDTHNGLKKLANQTTPALIHNIIKSVQAMETSKPLDCLPNRMKDHVKFFKTVSKSQGEIIHCDLCKSNIENKVNLLISHIVLSAPHIALTKEKYNYYCEICNVRVMNETGWLNHDFNGPRHRNMAASRKPKVAEYECTTCKTILYGDEISLTRHLDIGNRGKKRDKHSKLPDNVKKVFHSKETILALSAKLVEEAEEVLRNSLTRDCCSRIEIALSEMFENCKVYPFGSRISGIANKGSDLDVFVDIGEMYKGERYQEPPDQVILIRKANKAFSKNREFVNINPVLTARTPILQIHHVPTDLACDLSFKHGLSVENTKFFRFCIQLQPILQPMILLIKKWVEHIQFENVSTYAMATLCIFFLQVNSYLISVDKLREINIADHIRIGGWKTIVYKLSIEETKKQIKSYPNTVCELLKEFFVFYNKFDFNTYVVCPLLGRVIKRTLFDTPNELPPEMHEYVKQLEGENSEVFKTASFMCIQDAFDLSHNLTKAVQQGTLNKFQAMCKLSVSHLESIK